MTAEGDGPAIQDTASIEAKPTKRRVLLPEPWGAVEAEVWQRDALPGVTQLAGPAIIEQPDTTVLVWPGWQGRSEAGNLILEREG